jgi:hypothetical protein
MATMAAMLGMMMAPMSGMTGNGMKTLNKDAVKVAMATRRPEQKRNITSGGRLSIYGKPSFAGNQRQYRKKCRRSPWIYKSKKLRSNN